MKKLLCYLVLILASPSSFSATDSNYEFCKNFFIQKQYANAKNHCFESAKKNNPESQQILGMLYYN